LVFVDLNVSKSNRGDCMGIKNEIESVEIDFEEPCGYDESTEKFLVGDEKNYQRILKIKISDAIFIYRQETKGRENLTIDVIPFHHVKRCVVALKEPIKPSKII
jgi:hypothetical protein